MTKAILLFVLFIAAFLPPTAWAFIQDVNCILIQRMQGDEDGSPACISLRDALNDREQSQRLLRDRLRIRAILQDPGSRRDLLHNPGFLRKMMHRGEMRRELLENSQMMHEMFEDMGIRCDLERNRDMMAEIERIETYRQEYVKQEADLLKELLEDAQEPGPLSSLPFVCP